MRAMWTFRSLDSVAQDARYAVRTLRHQTGVAVTIVMVLAAVIGLNTTLFTVIAGVAWRPWSGVVGPDTVVRLHLADPSGRVAGFSAVDARSLEQSSSLAGIAVMDNQSVRVGSGETIAPANALMVSGSLFQLLGISMTHGRGILASDDRLGAPLAVAVLSHAYWQSHYGGDSGIVGARVQINDVPFTIVGVMSPAFGSSEPAYDKGLLLPMSTLPLLSKESSAQRFLHDPTACCVDVVARLAPGMTASAAQSELDVLATRLTAFSGNAATGILVTDTAFLSQPGRGNSTQALTSGALLAVAVSLVWLIACANVGNLLLSKAVSRVGEIGTRLALGATRGRIVRQLLIEGAILALAAAAAGVVIAYQLPFVLFRMVAEPGTIGFFPFSVTPDLSVLVYAVLLAGFSSVAFALAPALFVTRTDIVAWLTSRDAMPTTRIPLRSALLAVQAAVSVTLLVSAGLLIRGVQRQADVFSPGFAVQDITALTFELPEGVYDRARTTAFFDQITQGVRALPIEAAAFASHEPFSRYRNGTMFYLPGENREHAKQILYLNVSPEYLSVLEIPLRAGRYFQDGDLTGESVVINESMARRYWPGENPVGKTFFMRPRGPENIMVVREVVGVVQNVRVTTSSEVPPMFYQAYRAGGDVVDFVSRDPRASQPPVLLLKGRSDVADEVSRIAGRLDPRVRVQAASLSASLDAMLQTARWGPILAATLGLFALALTTVGVSGVFAFAVRQRRREIGIRMALGAPSAAVVRLVMTDHARALSVGLLLGLMGSIAASMILQNRLHGLSPFDPVAYLSVAALLAMCGLSAGVWPARRATRINPVDALRQL
jgi:putative ABC transport system permease protein